MNKLIGDILPLICGVYFLLIIKGVVKLPQEKQQRFDDYIRSKKQLMIVLCYILITITIVLIVRDLFFTKSI